MYRHNWNAERRYRAYGYVWPRAWNYRRWAYGERLPVIYWPRQYWLTSYWNYGLFNPPYGYVWVRYRNDAVLLDVETGEILSVVYDLFE